MDIRYLSKSMARHPILQREIPFVNLTQVVNEHNSSEIQKWQSILRKQNNIAC